jgi:hypothetical protein
LPTPEQLAQEMTAIIVFLAPAYHYDAAPWSMLPRESQELVIAAWGRILEKYPLRDAPMTVEQATMCNGYTISGGALFHSKKCPFHVSETVGL